MIPSPLVFSETAFLMVNVHRPRLTKRALEMAHQYDYAEELTVLCASGMLAIIGFCKRNYSP
jgi:hypothetical protein